jgi:hypothetical protein
MSLKDQLNAKHNQLTTSFLQEEVINKSMPPSRTIGVVEATLIALAAGNWLFNGGSIGAVLGTVLGSAGVNQIVNRQKDQQDEEDTGDVVVTGN